MNQENNRQTIELKDTIIGPQPGPQTDLLACAADICIYGGGAGGGKTFGMLLDFLQHYEDRESQSVFFRRTTPEIKAVGGPWETALELYSMFDAYPVESKNKIVFPSKAEMRFCHLENEKDKTKHQGDQIAVMYFDELSHFTFTQFWYLASRNRSMSRIIPYIRATTNPAPDSWIADFISWWLDQDTGFAIPERSGVIRYFYQYNDRFYWADTAKELEDKFPNLAKVGPPLSATFIPSLLDDNKILMEKDPSYKAKLLSLRRVDKERLLKGNWKVREDAGDYFKRDYFDTIEESELPADLLKVRFWDRAGTSAKELAENKERGIKQARTASVLLSFCPDNRLFYIEHITNDLLSPKQVVKKITDIVSADGPYVTIGLSQDPGQAGKFELEFYKERFGHYHVWETRETGSKESRAKPVSAQAEKHKIKLVRGHWNEEFIRQAENFPEGLKDIIDALSGAFSYFVENKMASLDVYEVAGIKRTTKDDRKKTQGYDSMGDDNPAYPRKQRARFIRNNW